MSDKETDAVTTATAMLRHVSVAKFVARNVAEAQLEKRAYEWKPKIMIYFTCVALCGEYRLVYVRVRAVQRQLLNN